jgi:hypothetical protein
MWQYQWLGAGGEGWATAALAPIKAASVTELARAILPTNTFISRLP